MNKATKKHTGSYYTPQKTIDFMLDYLDLDSEFTLKVLEPSVGDGRFIGSLKNRLGDAADIDAIELDKEKTKSLELEYHIDEHVKVINQDFLNFAQNESPESYDLIIGNPPYINKKNMSRETLDFLMLMAKDFSLKRTICQNVWVGFILGSVKLIKKSGEIFFVLPLEFLQVNYAESLRNWLEKNFNTIHVLTFEERMFPEIEQETCLVYLTNRIEAQPSILYRRYNKLNLSTLNGESSIIRNKPLKKWSNAILTDDEVELLGKECSTLSSIATLGECAPGVVTAANNELILTRKECVELKATDFVKPIISKGSYLQNEVEINQELIQRLDISGKKNYLLDLRNAASLPNDLKDYLERSGNKIRNGKKIKDSYKCSRRNPWYGVALTHTGDVCFFKRYNIFPRLCFNSSKVLTTDIAYNLKLDSQYDARSLVFSFYNSFTLALCEFCCRYYGGGVAELTPSEFRSLKIPYREISNLQWQKFVELMRTGTEIQNVTRYVDSIVLHDWPLEEVKSLRRIWKKLILRRSKNRIQ